MRVLITGAAGMLGQAVTHVFTEEQYDVLPFAKSALDITNAAAVREALRTSTPNVVINCAAYTRVDDAEKEKEQAYRINGIAATQLARSCKEAGARYLYPSTDYVFDGKALEPYTPDSKPMPLNVYGRSKLAGEQGAREAGDYLVVRTSWLYGAGSRNFVRTIADRVREGKPLRVVADQRGAPTWAYDLARVFAGLLEHGAPRGTYHATNSGSTTWYDLAVEIARRLGADVAIQPCTTAEYGALAPRPAFSVLNCSRTEQFIGPIRDWQSALQVALQSGAF
jgi:dTDP-4-dehydrorhamnose reductase